MKRDEVKASILELFAGFASGRWDDPAIVLTNMAEDGEWWAAGYGGKMTKAEFIEALKMAGSGSAGGMMLTPISWIIEGDWAAVEAMSEMPLKNGTVYKNQYHFAIQVKDGKVFKVKEYFDTAAAQALRTYLSS